MLELYDTVRVKKPWPEYGLTTENIGGIVDIQGDGTAFTVDFLEDDENDYMDALFHYFKAEDLVLVEKNIKS